MDIAVYEEGRFAVPVYESVRFNTMPGEMLSLIPQPRFVLQPMG